MHQHSKIQVPFHKQIQMQIQLQMALLSVMLRNSMSKKFIFLIEIMILKIQRMHGWTVAPQHCEGQVKGD